MARPKAIVSWSSGKDSALALHEVRSAGAFELVGLLTTVTDAHRRVSMHGVRDELLQRQADAVGLSSFKVSIPSPCSNEVYEREMSLVLQSLRAQGVTTVVFGDLFLEDVRSYREARLREAGMSASFPLWKRDTRALAREMLGIGMRARLTCVDPRKLDRSFAGRSFDEHLLRELPANVDPCGENGEFHTLVTAGPMFRHPIDVAVGELVERDGFVFADMVPVPSSAGAP